MQRSKSLSLIGVAMNILVWLPCGGIAHAALPLCSARATASENTFLSKVVTEMVTEEPKGCHVSLSKLIKFFSP